jgi:putative phosphoserine phosphatase/1-acylglycerol-3-phosphate O-acyltransferase
MSSKAVGKRQAPARKTRPAAAGGERRARTARVPAVQPAPPAAAAVQPPHWIAEIEASPDGPTVGAFIDFDGTVIPGYSILAFIAERWRRREIGVADVGRTARMLAESLAGAVTQRDMIEQGMTEWRGKPLAEAEALGQEIFSRDLEPDVFPEMRQIVAAHLAKGHTVAIATSAALFQVAPAASSLGISDVLCTRLEVEDGHLTGRASGPILRGVHKARAVQEFAAQRGVDLRRSFFYADGDEDEALMHLVGNPRPVNPKPQLARVAGRRHWPVRRFASRGRPGADVVLRNLAATASAVPVFLGAAAIRLLTGRKREAANLLSSTLTDIALALGEAELNVLGEENLWSARPAVFIWNHRNIFDAQIVGNLVRRDFGAVAKKELEKVPLFAAASRFMHIAFLDRGNSKAAVEALEPATRLLGQGISMLVAPEGTRAAGNTVAPFKKGAFRMAMEARVPIVPIVIRNADELGARNSQFMRPGKVDVLVLPPVSVEDWTRADLDGRIEAVRRLYVEALADWPGPEATHATP